MLETLQQQQEMYLTNLVNSVEETDRQHWYNLLNEVLEQLLQLKYDW